MDERFRQVLRAARAGDTNAQIQLAAELSRAGYLSGAVRLTDYDPSSVPLRSFVVPVIPSAGTADNAQIRHEPFGLCVVPLPTGAVYVRVGPDEGSARSPEGTSSISSWLATGKRGRSYVYQSCDDLRGPIYYTRSTRRSYELSGHCVLRSDGSGRWAPVPGRELALHFPWDLRRQPSGYRDITRRISMLLTPTIRRVVGEFLRSHPEAFSVSSWSDQAARLLAAVEHLERVELMIAAARTRVGESAVDLADALGL